VLRVIADALQVVKVFRRDALKNPAHARHGDRLELRSYAAGVDTLAEVLHQFATLSIACTFSCACARRVFDEEFPVHTSEASPSAPLQLGERYASSVEEKASC
jgi:hypothetical protein